MKNGGPDIFNVHFSTENKLKIAHSTRANIWANPLHAQSQQG